MITKRIAIFAAAATAVLLSADMASAQGMGRGPVANACSREIGRYCADIPHGGGAVRACLEDHSRRLSGHCRAALRGTGYGQRWR